MRSGARSGTGRASVVLLEPLGTVGGNAARSTGYMAFANFGNVIPGLFAVGDCVGGIAPAIGLGGVKISSAVTLGRIAGRVAAGGERNAAAAATRSVRAPVESAPGPGEASGPAPVASGQRIPIVG